MLLSYMKPTYWYFFQEATCILWFYKQTNNKIEKKIDQFLNINNFQILLIRCRWSRLSFAMAIVPYTTSLMFGRLYSSLSSTYNLLQLHRNLGCSGIFAAVPFRGWAALRKLSHIFWQCLKTNVSDQCVVPVMT